MEELHEKAKIISGDKDCVEVLLKQKKIIYRQLVGRLANYTVFDNFTEEELEEFRMMKISCSSVNLQKLFINLAKGGFSSEEE